MRRRVASILAGPLLLVPCARAGDWYVDQSYAQCAQSDGSMAKPFCTLADALTVAGSGDTLHVAPGFYQEVFAPTVDLTVIGTQGAALTSIGGTGSVHLQSVSLEMHGITVRDATAPARGAGIEMYDGALILEDCSVQNCLLTNYVSDGGAGIYASNSTLELRRTDFGNNWAGIGGGYGYGGALLLLDCHVSVDHCRFDRNGSGSRAGAIEARSSGSLLLEDCLFEDNVSAWSGGLFVTKGVATTISFCTFQGNFATRDGGAIAAERGAALRVTDSWFEANSGQLGGAVHLDEPTEAIERCTFLRNVAHPYSYFDTGKGGGLWGDSVVLRDCVFESNHTEWAPNLGISFGGGVFATGDSQFSRCRFFDNVAEGSGGGSLGGGMYCFVGSFRIEDCEFVGNVAEGGFGEAGGGGGLIVNASGRTEKATIERTSFGGNRAILAGASSGGEGGGLLVVPGSTVSLSHVVLADNLSEFTGPDLSGTVTTLGYNVLGDSSGATLIGAGPGDLLDVDPLFTDSGNGDLDLLPGSPCIDSGDPAFPPGGKDVGAAPRVLDGDLDRSMVLDRGGREFGAVHLAVTGNLEPGGAIQLDSTGTAGLPLFLFAGIGEADVVLVPYGSLFVDLGQTYLFTRWGTVPNVVNTTLPNGVPVPFALFLQEIAFVPHAGNFSNLVVIDLR